MTQQHCGEHDELIGTVSKVDVNVEWIIKALKITGSIAGVVITLIVIPTAIWLVSLNTRVTNLETRLTLHINPEANNTATKGDQP